MKKSSLLACALLGLFVISNAQTVDKKWAVGLHGGRTTYNGDLGQGFYRLDQPFYAFGGVSLSRWLSSRFDIVAGVNYGEVGYSERINDKLSFSNTLTDACLSLRLKMQKDDDKFFSPYLMAGLGIANFSDDKINQTRNAPAVVFQKKGMDFILPSTGFGINFRLSPVLNLQLQQHFLLTNKDRRDGESHDANDAFLHHTVGLTFNIGAKKDNDKDGVADRMDKCPTTPLGVAVDAVGCPVDKDADGVADFLDKCPEVKGAVTAAGCPDADGDGIADADDKCPAEAGLLAMNGCPDADGDGVTDIEDMCPDLKGLKNFSGCPDSDGDGITDKEDACPELPGDALLKGCPDGDKDGVSDKDDKCPDEAGIAANKGCPEIKEEVKELFKKALQGIQFETGKDVIRKVSFTILDNVVKVMQDNPAYLIDINGYTDDVGDENANLTLSQNRAAAVKQYLQDKGVNANRIKSAGFGEANPVANNKTATGRALNRRVEFVVQF
ncbi:MAG: OmpA family protein [Bacteroidetes bacterium]|nr:OmpA family protein [Bacteroidota bacterium]